ncbi:MAG: T9SS type A sorting domain-containing protein [Dysgonamonadaceae bacterium]|jgi:ELWxxDGT repeat protein|nr:T9SS type A sorting domain-containing protein [Dysgonamonadaceae bacterium]
MKNNRCTFLILLFFLSIGGAFAQLMDGAGGTLVSLLPDGVSASIETNQKKTKSKNLVVAGEKSQGYKAFFAASDATHGEELWVTDGTVAGTKMVKDINPGVSSSDLNWMARFNDKVVFAANDGTNGMELWISDGTEAGTRMVKQIHEWGDGSNPNAFIQINETQFVFRAKSIDSENYESGSAAGAKQYWLWISDGTEAGTRLLYECDTRWPGQDNGTYHYHWMRVGRKVFFKADYKEGITKGEELWITDGTTAGTRMIKDINWEVMNPTTPEDGKTRNSAIDQMVNFYNEKLFFKAWTPETGNEPWASDGTEAGTYMIKDTDPTVNDAGIGNGGNMTEVAEHPYNGKVYARGWYTENNTIQLGATNLEKEDFTILVCNKSPLSSGTGGKINGWPDPGVNFDGVYLFCAQSGTSTQLEYNYGGELHYTDGTTVTLQSDLAPGATQHNWVKELTVAGGSAYWWCDVGAATGMRQKLFRIDNKEQFPVQVTDFDPNGDEIHSLRNMGGTLIFARGSSEQNKGVYAYSYRKAAYDPAKDADSLDIEYRTRAEITGIETAQTTAKFAVFPNPATDKFSFNVEGKVMSVKIFDLTGRLVKMELQPTGNSVNVSSMQKGIYTVSITSAKNTYTSRLIIK